MNFDYHFSEDDNALIAIAIYQADGKTLLPFDDVVSAEIIWRAYDNTLFTKPASLFAATSEVKYIFANGELLPMEVMTIYARIYFSGAGKLTIRPPTTATVAPAP